MRQKYVIAGTGLLCLCLAGYVAFAGGQVPLPPSPTNPTPPPLLPSPGVGALPAPPGAIAPLPRNTMPDLPPAPISPPVGTTAPAPVLLPGGPTPGLAMPIAPPVTTPSLPPPPGTNPELVPGPMVPATQVHQVGSPGTSATPPEEANPVSSVTADNPAGRQEPSVSIEWLGPPSAKVAQPGDYGILVRNTSNAAVNQVVVRVKIPNGLQVMGSEPKANQEASHLVWDIGTLVAKQEKNLTLKMQATTKGDLLPQAWVSFSGSSTLRIRVREPKLALKTSAPEKVLVGDAVAFTLTVTNPGDGTADQVKIQALLSEGLVHSRGNKVDFDIGNLGAGESRSVQLICEGRNGGAQKCEGLATSEGGAIKAADVATVNVIKPHLDVALVGPGLRYLERKAIYTLKVTNPGDAPATNVTVSQIVPTGFKVLAASDGGRHDYSTRTVSWFMGEVGPAQTREVKLEVQAIGIGDHKHKALAVGARGLRAESELTTKVEGLSALLVEMVDTEDPIEVGAETAYEIRVTNTGSQTESDIKLLATIPEKMEFKSATAPVRYRVEGRKVIFESLERLAPRADAIFKLTVKGTEPGVVRFETMVTSSVLKDGVIKQEATRIYADQTENTQGRVQPQVAPPAGVPGGASAPGLPIPVTPPGPLPMGGPTPLPIPGSLIPGQN